MIYPTPAYLGVQASGVCPSRVVLLAHTFRGIPRHQKKKKRGSNTVPIIITAVHVSLIYILQFSWFAVSLLLMFAFYYPACSFQESWSASSAAIPVVCQAQRKGMETPSVSLNFIILHQFKTYTKSLNSGWCGCFLAILL